MSSQSLYCEIYTINECVCEYKNIDGVLVETFQVELIHDHFFTEGLGQGGLENDLSVR